MKLPIQFPTCLRTLAVRIEGGWKHSVEMEKVYIFVFLWQNKTTSWWMMRDARLRNEQSGTHHFNVVNGWKTPHKNIDVNKCSSIWNMPWFRSDSLGRRGDRVFSLHWALLRVKAECCCPTCSIDARGPDPGVVHCGAHHRIHYLCFHLPFNRVSFYTLT